jgi:serine/threonine-protein kinase SRK2
VSKYVEREILNHRRLVHPHIIRFKEVILTDVHICIVMEYAEGGDMFDYVLKRGGLREHEARWFFQQVIVATDYVHQMGMANRDIKLENTLMDLSPKPLIKLCDFGYSKHEKLQSAPGSRVGTPAYLAPEVISTLKGDTYDGKIADIWSCGVMLYVMLTGSYPFERQGDKTSASKLQLMIARILKVDYKVCVVRMLAASLQTHSPVCTYPQFPPNVDPSPELQDLLDRILTRDPARRITIAEIFEHPWFCKDLPPGVREMNTNMRNHSSGFQTEEEIIGLLREAENLPLRSLDGQIDDALGH